jgi:hypothetical protein
MATTGTFALISDANDGRDNWNGDVWPGGFVSQDATQVLVMASKRGSSPIYDGANAFFGFNTASIPDESLIVSGTLQFWVTAEGNSLAGGGVILTTITTPTSAVYGTTNLGSLMGSIATGQYINLPINMSTNPINKTGTTALGLVEWYKFTNTVPASVASSSYTLSDTGDATNKPAQLIVVYDNATGLDTTSKMW